MEILVEAGELCLTPIESTEYEADKWIRAHGITGRDGVYTEAALSKKAHTHEQPYADLDGLAFGGELDSLTLEFSEMIALGHMAKLTERQQQVWERRVLGATFQEIGDDLGISRQRACEAFLRARELVLTCFEMSKYYGLWDVYVELINRICKARPCKRGGSAKKYLDISRLASCRTRLPCG